MSIISEDAAPLAATTPDQTTNIVVSAIEGNQLTVKYTGMPSNLANTYGNYLVCWRNQNTIPWNDSSPAGYEVVKINDSQGSQVFEKVTVAAGVSYVVGYAVGPKGSDSNPWKNVCTTGFIPVAGDPGQYITPLLSVNGYEADSVSVNFTLPDGCTPNTNGAWIGIWQSGQASYSTPPKASNSINLDSSQGGAGINSLNLILRGQSYTVALFTSGWKAGAGGANVQTAMACSVSFKS